MDNHDTIDGNLDSGQVRIEPDTFHQGGVWVDGKDLLSAVLQLMVDGFRCLTPVTGNTRHHNASSAKKLGDCFRTFAIDHPLPRWPERLDVD
jgi:hypothetical protein